MRKILQIFLSLSMLILLLPPLVQAQERAVTGTILSEDTKTPLSGVTVKVKGTRRIVQTDASGRFSIMMTSGETLQITYVGYQTEEVKPGSSTTVAVSMKTADNTMGEVVVTAMDIKRNPRELGYSVQKVSGQDIKESQRENFVNGLQGRVAGLTVNPTSGLAGSSSMIVLRGFNSMALDNQPLFVIDGVIADNSTMNQTSNTNSGLGLVETSSRNVNETANRQGDYSNRISDLNPNDIETITVLKGPEATALYGSQASSGAIIITTKKGNNNGKLGINYDNSFRVSNLTRFPETQNVYGNGFNGVTQSDGLFRYFGPKYPDGTKIYDNVDAFFKTSFTHQHNLSLDYGKKNWSFRVSGSYLDQGSPIPENTYKRFNVRASGNVKLGKMFDISPSLSYIRSVNNKPLRGVNGYMLGLLIWPANYDVRDWKDQEGDKKLVFAATQNGEIDNPFFSANRNRGRDETDRKIATLGINFTPFSWMTISGRFGYDTYQQDGYTFYHPQSFILTKSTGGSMDNYYRHFEGYNHTINLMLKRTFGKVGARVMVGTMWQDYRTEVYSVYGTNIVDSVNTAGDMVKDNQIVTLDQIKQWMGDSSRTRATSRLRLNNARKGLPNYVLSRQLAYFGEVGFSWNNYFFIAYTHRFETSSIFPKDFRNYNYPAGSASLILSDMFPGIKKGNIVNYVKLRTSLASTARSSDPYRNQSVFNPVTSSGGGYAYGFDNNNYFLEPEIQRTYEVGTELRMFKSKLNVDITYYNTLCKKQIFQGFRASYGTGYVLNTLNIGTTRNKGVEVSLSSTIMTKKDFTWDMRLNFNKMYNKVLELPFNVTEVYLSDIWPYLNARGGMVAGGPTTSITAFGYQRTIKGDILIDPTTGLPLSDGQFLVRGNRNPDFTLGWVNNLRYKNWKLNFLWDLKVGGDVINLTDQYLTINGKSKRTLDRETPRVIQGVLKDGKENSATPTVNSIVVIPYYNSAYYSSTNMPDEAYIEHDVNWFRLREATLSYTFPSTKLKNMSYVKSLGLFLTANDLILMTNYTGADPAVNAVSAGVRGVGGWGFDYGNAGAPVSFTFGIRAGF